MYRHVTILAAVILISTSLAAQQRNRGDRDHQRQQTSELRADLHSWMTSEVLPEVLTWQREFDATLSASELATLRELRTKAATLRNQIRSELQNARSLSYPSDRKVMKGQLRVIRDRHRNNMRAILDQLEPIAKAHRDDLRALFDKHENQIDAWRNELHSRIDDADLGRGLGTHRMDDASMILGHGRQMAQRFLLWNGEMPPLPSPRSSTRTINPGGQLPPVSVSPNPSEHTARVRMDGMPNGPITIDLFDMIGNLVRSQSVSITGKRLDETISIDGLAPGTYMVSVNTPNGRRTETLVVTK